MKVSCSKPTALISDPVSLSLQRLYLVPVLSLLAGGQGREQARDGSVDYLHLVERRRLQKINEYKIVGAKGTGRKRGDAGLGERHQLGSGSLWGTNGAHLILALPCVTWQT